MRSLAGSGVYVREQARLPGAEDAEHPLAGAAAFLFEMGQLKEPAALRMAAAGHPETRKRRRALVRDTTVGITLAAIAGADIGRTAALCTLHDAHETRIGDVPAVGRAYVTTASPEAVTAHQTAGMPADAGKAIQELIAEYEDNETPEAHLAHDADKIEMLIQAIEYQALGADTTSWQENALSALRTDAGAELARAVTSSSPHWWAAFNASYSELRASTRARKQLRKAVE